MWSRLKNSIINDMKIIAHDAMLMVLCLTPFILIILLKFIFPLLSGLLSSKTGFYLDSYYSFTAITFISVIPVLIGIVYGFILHKDKETYIWKDTPVTSAGRRNFLFLRILVPAFFCFILVMITILLEKPVPTEGWLRTLFVAFLLSIQSSFIFLFISAFTESRIPGSTLCWLCWIFLIAVPLGLVLHHPWNYFAFYSPLYWIAWVWIIHSPVESMIYGSIAVILTLGAITILIRKFLRKYAG